ncbi:MAG TPA: trypsin-like peptidase domain-containing protein [Solirubrobacterales bacterium]|nr:trypsin-like peptidase domain-containing protein [Solirubrobacterales bacterium]
MSGRGAAIAALIAAAALGVGACGGGSGDSGSVTTVASSNAPGSATVSHSGGDAFDPEAVYHQAAPGVVTILSIFSGGGLPSLLGGNGGAAAQGSGLVISDGGEIATNAHVVTDATGPSNGPIHEAKEVFVQFADRNQVPAHIVGFDPNADVALLTVDPNGLDLSPLRLATNEAVQVGQPVAAIGSPFGEDQSLSVGVVSATDRSIESLTRFQIEGAIQTDASINPGNSGGPMLDANGNVIGINQQINTTSGGNEGVGFAVPIGLAAHALDQLRANGSVKYAYIGVTTQSLYPQLADRLNLPTDTGALVAKVIPGGPADDAGLRGSDQKIRFQGQQVDAGGDVIVAIDGHKIVTENDLPEIIARYQPGDTVTVQIIRDGHTQNLDVKLGERPASGG